MVLTPNPRVVFAKRPGAGNLPIPGEHIVYDASPTIDLDAVPLNGGFLTKTLMLSPEPFLRERMRDLSVQSYSTHAVVGAPVVGTVLVVVLRSEKEGVNVGDHMSGLSHWEAYTVQPYVEGRADLNVGTYPDWTVDLEAFGLAPVPDPHGAYPWSCYFSVLGGPGLTAFFGFEAYGDAKKGETIYVSSGASGVGSVVIQLAKEKGLRVIASAGSDAKVEYMRSIGADVAFNYKTTPVEAALKEHGPLDIYWDNVGGASIKSAIEHARARARFIMCGSISEYNTPPSECYGVKNTSKIFKKRLQIHGLFVGDHVAALAPRFYTEVPALMAQGKMHAREALTEGLENAPEALMKLLQEGGAEELGKPVVVVAKE
ncbi:Zinc-type alcohol dehydrogenase-like protein PB24D3.08c [Mycena venus]|uniref:Zinc-type alcohol dehydrogenase-like protein PB24D3.08c n=1 Tax=Mycena venus TaxID=2733690 RepID=A0A8H6YLW6_9AGAR|nr:Zinc-type alcohol dehydrogenase-like protein PB24D3.08c [Mycena venus]